MANTKVYVLTRTGDGDVIVDGVFTTRKKAEIYRDQLLGDFGVSLKDWKLGNSQYDFDIHPETVQ